MRRRSLILGAISLVAAAGLAVLGSWELLPLQKAAPKMARLGLPGYATVPAAQTALRAGLRSHGWIERQNLVLELRDPYPPSADQEAYVDLARELVRLPVDVILTYATPATLAALHVTDHTPPKITSPAGVGSHTARVGLA